jgi:hypothetical protein
VSFGWFACNLTLALRTPLNSQMTEKVAGLDGQVFTVVRRFNDFAWLRGQLRDQLPYLIIPALPEKQQMGRFNSDFVDVRLRALQRWVDRISSHPEVTTTGAITRGASAVKCGAKG